MNNVEPTPQGQQESTPPPPPAEKRRGRVLLIEDESLTRLVLLQKLRSAGFEVDTVSSGHLALMRLNSTEPDAIFMDLLLPFNKGSAVIKEARRNKKFADRPIFVCTSAAHMEAWTRKGIKAGATRVFNKATTPIDDIIAQVTRDLCGDAPTSAAPQASEPESATPKSAATESAAPKPAVPASAQSPKTESVSGNRVPQDQPKSSGPKVAEAPAASKSFVGHFGAPAELNVEAEIPVPKPSRSVKSFKLNFKKRNAEPATEHPVESAPVAAASESPMIPGEQKGEQKTEQHGPAAEETAIWIRVKDTKQGEIAPWAAQDSSRSVPITPDIGIVQIDRENKIVSTSDLCEAMFHCDYLLGRDFGVLLKDDLNNEVGQFLKERPEPGESEERRAFRVTARRADGTEFPASLVLTHRPSDSGFCWTAIFGTFSPGDSDTELLGESQTQQSRRNDAPMIEPVDEVVAEDLLRLEKERDELNARLAAEEKAAVEFRQQSENLEVELRVRRNELERANESLAHGAEERGALEAGFREQLDAANALTKKMETAWLEEVARNKIVEERLKLLRESLKLEQAERNKRFEDKVSELSQVRQELDGKLAAEQQAATESRRRAVDLEGKLLLSSVEVDRVKAQLEARTAEQKHLRSEWREQLTTAEALTKELEAAYFDADKSNRRFEEELSGLRQSRDELNSKLVSEQQMAADSRRRAEELENRLNGNTEELERVRAELEKAGRNEESEKRLATLQQVHDELNGRLRSEQEAATQSRTRSQDLEKRLFDNTSELEKIRGEREKSAAQTAALEADLRAQLNTARSAAERAEKAVDEKSAQCSQFQNDLADLRNVRDELATRLTTEQESASRFRQRTEDLESRLHESASEMDRFKAEREQQSIAQARLESELRLQLGAAETAASRAREALENEAARNLGFEERLRLAGDSFRKQEAERHKQYEHEIALLRQARDEIAGKFSSEQRAAAESRRRSEELERRLRASAEESERIKAAMNLQAQERTASDAQLRAQLAAANQTAQRFEATEHEGNAFRSRLEEQLAASQRVHQELTGNLAGEQQAAADATRRAEELEARLREATTNLEGIQEEFAKSAEQRKRAEAKLRAQIEAAKTATREAEAATKEKVAELKRLTKHFEADLANLRRERLEICEQFTAEKQTTAKFRRQVVDLQKHLQETEAGFSALKTELEKNNADRQRAEAELQAQLGSAKEEARVADHAHKEEGARSVRLQQEIDLLQRARDEITARLAGEEHATGGLKQRIAQLEGSLRESTDELEHLKTELINQVDPTQIADLEARLRDSVTASARVTADLEKEHGERVRSEQRAASLSTALSQLHEDLRQHLESEKVAHGRMTELENDLEERERTLVSIKANLRQESSDRQLAEEQLEAVGDLGGQLREYLSLFEQSKHTFTRAQTQLQTQLEATVRTLNECQSRLQTESSERKRLDDALADAQRRLSEESQKSAVELSKLRSDLVVEQFERKRLEGDSLQNRHAALDSARVGRATVSKLRKHIRQPFDSLVQATRRLLQLPLNDEQAALAKEVLKNALVVEERLDVPATTQPVATGKGGKEGPPDSDSLAKAA